MTKEQYLFLLQAELNGELPEQELQDILRYYEEYFEEAGPDREREVMLELGSPQRLAQKILGMEPRESMEPLDTGRAAWGPEPEQTGRSLSKGVLLVLAVLAAIAAVPTWAGLVLGLGAGGIVCVLVGRGIAVSGALWGGVAVKLFAVGGGLMAFAIGLLMLLGAAALAWSGVKCVRWVWGYFTEGEYEG